ncbi:MAG: CmcI family methyltransferase [Rhodospirillaceae bacterium]
MHIEIDTEGKTLVSDRGKRLDLYSKEAFDIISEIWLKAGWNQKYSYTFTWMGRPVIQNPEDLLRIQEVVYSLRPDVIVETGVAHGGSLVFYASLFKAMGKPGRVVGVDIEIRPNNRSEIEAHDLFSYITLIEGSSVLPEVVSQVAAKISPEDKVLVILDSCHTKDHVLKELEAYGGFVTPGSYVIVADGIMKLVADTPRGDPLWIDDNPMTAVDEYLISHPEFRLAPPAWRFNESELDQTITYLPGGWLQRIG